MKRWRLMKIISMHADDSTQPRGIQYHRRQEDEQWPDNLEHRTLQYSKVQHSPVKCSTAMHSTTHDGMAWHAPDVIPYPSV